VSGDLHSLPRFAPNVQAAAEIINIQQTPDNNCNAAGASVNNNNTAFIERHSWFMLYNKRAFCKRSDY